jgi:hypothetical protein
MLAERLSRQKELRLLSARELRGIESRLRPTTPERRTLLSRPKQFRDEQVRRDKPRGKQHADSDLCHPHSFPTALVTESF